MPKLHTFNYNAFKTHAVLCIQINYHLRSKIQNPKRRIFFCIKLVQINQKIHFVVLCVCVCASVLFKERRNQISNWKIIPIEPEG